MLEQNSTVAAGKQGSQKERKKGGNLAQTLDRTLEPRIPPGKPGRPKGIRNYEWTPEMDKLLVELWRKYDPGKAKAVMGKRLLEFCPRDPMPRKDSVRSAVERRARILGLTISTKPPHEKPAADPGPNPEPNLSEPPKEKVRVVPRTWDRKDVTALLGMIGGDLTDDSLVKRTRRSVKAVHAKLRRLGYLVSELRSVAFTLEEAAHMFQVTVEEVQSWRRKGWLPSTRRRITDVDLTAFLTKHEQLIAFAKLAPYVRTFLMSLGFPATEAKIFHANVKSILENVTGRKRCGGVCQRTERKAAVHPPPAWTPTSDARVEKKISRWTELKHRPQQAGRFGPLRLAAAV